MSHLYLLIFDKVRSRHNATFSLPSFPQILDCAGNLFDAVSIGVKAALWATHMPRIYVTGEDGGELEFGVSDNPLDTERINVSNAPILITHLRVRLCII